MIGNDIVDLQTALLENNWRRKGYLQKIFTDDEQEYIFASNRPDQIVWLLWSMKEAAYKIINRATNVRSYAPVKLVCSIRSITDCAATGQVAAYGSCYQTASQMNHEIIHSLAQSPLSNIAPTVVLLSNTAEEQHYNKYLTQGYAVMKNKYGLPYVIDINSGHYKYASLSHHGSYAALAIGSNM